VTVAEILPEVVEWNRGELGELAGRPLADPRVRVEVADVAVAAHGAGGPFDAILLDVDNGPSAPLLIDNLRLYDHAGLTRLRDALAPGGVLAVWSAYAEPGFVRALGKAGFEARSRRVSARPGRKGPHHALFLAHRNERSERPRPRRRGR
jgi:spermidine synthase